MSALANYFPSFEEVQDPEDFLKPVDLVEARLAAEQADSNVEEAVDIQATLEALCASMEANLEADRWTPVFIGHSLDAIGRRTGLKFPKASLEDNQITISMEGLGDALKKIWEAIVNAVNAAIKAVGEFFKRVWAFVTGKKDKVESNIKKTKEGGDTTPAKLAAENTLDKIHDKEVVETITNKLEDPALAKARPADLVIVTNATATALDRAVKAEQGGDAELTKEEVSLKGKHFTITLKKEVQKATYVKLGMASNDFISHASLAGVTLLPIDDHKCEIKMKDLEELIWETLFRGRTIREVGQAISTHVVALSTEAIDSLNSFFKAGGKGLNAWEKGGRHDLNNRMFLKMESIFSEFKKLRNKDNFIPAGRQISMFGPGKDMTAPYGGRDTAPFLAKFTDREVLLQAPNWSTAKKASDGVTSMMVMNYNTSDIDKISRAFSTALALWDKAIKSLDENKLGDDYAQISSCYTNLTRSILTYTQNHFNRFLRSQLAMEGYAVQWSDMLFRTTASIVDSKDLVREFG